MGSRTPGYLLLIALLPCLTACGAASDPAEEAPFSHPMLIEANTYGGETPAGATLKSPEAFAALLDRGEAFLVTTAGIQDELDRAAADEADARSKVRAEFANHPDLMEMLDHTLEPDDPDFKRLPDGSLLYRGIHADEKSSLEERSFVLSGVRFGLQELLRSKELFESAETQHGIYAQMYPLLPTPYILDNQLPHPSEIEQESFDVLRELNGGVAQDWDQFFGSPDPLPWPEGYPASWRDEEGVDYRSDRDTPFDLYPVGLWSLLNFPLKWCATHVRDQGNRGTDRAFAVTAAVEARFAALNSRWLNLSEQMLYNQANGFWYPRDFERGLRIATVLGQMATIHFRYPFEASWDYNPSLFREELPLGYVKSCWVDAAATLYGGGFCSDTSHQSPLVYSRIERREFVMKVNPLPLVPHDSRVHLTGWREIYLYGSRFTGPDGPEDPLATAKIMLNLKIPVTLLFWVPRTFSGANPAAGIVPFDPTVDYIGATHAMVMLGYISNIHLPPGTPPGSGGGYFICKNSFGTGWGDAGYCYISDDWVWKYAYSMQAVSDVTTR